MCERVCVCMCLHIFKCMCMRKIYTCVCSYMCGACMHVGMHECVCMVWQEKRGGGSGDGRNPIKQYRK